MCVSYGSRLIYHEDKFHLYQKEISLGRIEPAKPISFVYYTRTILLSIAIGSEIASV